MSTNLARTFCILLLSTQISYSQEKRFEVEADPVAFILKGLFIPSGLFDQPYTR